jgi:PEP-CTERM motif
MQLPHKILIAALLGAASASAMAITTLTYHWTDVTCGIVSAGGATTSQPCPGSGPSFTALVQPGESAFVTATLAYSYHDDGLLLDRPETFQVDPFGLRNVAVYHEASSLYFISNQCTSRSCGQPPERTDSFSGPFSILFGNDDVPDDQTGRIDFSAKAGLANSFPGPESRTVFFNVSTVRTFSQVNAVPEPSTYALMLAGLAMVGTAARRRRRG